MEKPPLIIGVKCKEWRGSGKSLASDTKYQEARKIALKRDNLVCQYCGFQAKKYQETHHINDDHNDNRAENLLTCCPLCHAVHHIGLVGVQGKGILIYAPDIGQQHINRLSMMFFAISKGVEQGNDFATRNYAIVDEAEYDLRDRKKYIAKAFGTDEAENPLWLANMLLSLPDKEYKERARLLSGVRLLHDYDGWKRENEPRIEYWSSLMLSKFEQKGKEIKDMLANATEGEDV